MASVFGRAFQGSRSGGDFGWYSVNFPTQPAMSHSCAGLRCVHSDSITKYGAFQASNTPGRARP